jgi:predicted ATPase
VSAATLEELAGSEAVALFVERARAIDAGFALDPENAAAVAAICAALDGLPLLTGGPRDRPERQRTLRGAIQWSHDLLDPDGQTTFRRLAAFAGGWSLEAAEAVCSPAGAEELDTLEALDALVQQSLARRDDGAPEPRSRMLQTIRELGLERLAESGEEPEVPEWHARSS